MAQNDRGVLGLIKATTPAITLGGLTKLGISPGINNLILAGGGEVDPRYICVMEQSPGMSISTPHIATALSSFGISGAQITDLEAYFRKIALYGERTDTACLKATFGDGLLVPTSLRAAQGQPASLDMQLFAVKTDGTASIVVTNGQTLPTGTQASEVFTVGPVSFNGTAFDVTDFTVNFGIEVRTEGTEGDVFHKIAYIISRRPVIQINTPEMLKFSDFGVSGTAQSTTDSVLYLRKKAANGQNVADGTAEHIKLTIDDGRIWCDDITGSDGEIIGTSITLQPISDGTNPIIAISTGSTIT